MPGELRRGMDHALYPFSPLPSRVPLAWPGGAPLAVSVVLYLDWWDLATPEGAHRAPDVHGMWGHQFPDLRTFTYRLYGERIGAYRILDLFGRLGIRATVAVGAGIASRYPDLIRRCLDLGHEIAAHGLTAQRMIHSRMSEEEERAHIRESREAVMALTGQSPAGWFGQDQGESTRTPGLLAQAGFSYLADWPNDEQPYWMSTAPSIVSLPLHTELDDQQFLWLHQQPSWSYPQAVCEAADRLASDARSQGQGRSLCLGVRSWLSGRPHRIAYLEQALAALRSREDVWIAPARDIVDAFRTARPDPASR
jgi:allantoinase